MSLISTLLDRLRRRRETSSSKYWTTLLRVAEGRLTERAAETAVESLANEAELLRKSEADVEQDIALLAELQVADEACAGEREAREGVRTAATSVADADSRASAMRSEAERLVRDAARTLDVARGVLAGVETAIIERDRLRRQLAERGHPGLATSVASEDAEFDRARRIALAEADLRGVVRDLDVQERGQRHREELGDVRSERVEATIETLRDRRGRLESELAALRGGGVAVEAVAP